MADGLPATLRETDLYPPVRDYLIAQGYTVRGEVKDCDVTAVKDGELIVVELKRGFGTDLLIQATRRQRVADAVYVALPRFKGNLSSARARGVQHLLRRLEIGLILVSLSTPVPTVEIVFHPLPYARKRSKHDRQVILREIAGRSGDYTPGGSTRVGIVTAYRENALFVACCLEHHGPLSPRQLRALGTGTKTLAIRNENPGNLVAQRVQLV